MRFAAKLFPGLLFVFCFFTKIQAQPTFPYNGVQDHRDGLYAFTNATIFKNYNEKIENATLVIRDGKVEAAGIGVRVPPDAVVIDASGKTIYPAFIDLYSDYGMPAPAAEGKRPDKQPQMLSNKAGAFAWNEALKSEFRAHENFKADAKTAKEMRDLGFGTVLSHRMDGISRGAATLVALGEERENEMILRERSAHVLSFVKGTSTQNYPSSLMGSIALIRQTYLDGQWYKNGGSKEETNVSLAAWNDLQSLPQIFDLRDKLDALRAAKIGKEFSVNYILKGVGDEYQRLPEIKATGAPLIIPVDFPEPFDVENPYEALQISLGDLKHWEMAPANAAMLAQAGIEFAFTANGLKNKSDFLNNVRKTILYGLTEEAALKALTFSPAKMIGAGDITGGLDNGKVASFFIADGNIFKKETKILQSWVQGKSFVIKDLDSKNLLGVYDLKVGNENFNLHIKGSNAEPKAVIQKTDSVELKADFDFQNEIITLSFPPEKDSKQRILLSGTINDNGWNGRGQLTDGRWADWSASYVRALPEREMKKDSLEKKPEIGQVIYPFVAFGWQEKPKAQTVLFKNATVWTNEKDGIVQNGDVLIENGKISGVGKNLKAPAGALTIDATGKHLTSGIIDEHTHIAATRGINEGTQSSSAEVRIGDVVNCDDINIYRQLSGGVTSAQILHGSANAIGGQSAIIKFRWGYAPEEMKFENADGFIKFALGENVKQSNWGDDNTIRFPQTRMGVEQVFVDHFTRAREYGKLKASGKPYRKDLELEALLEILESKRFITCHSYRQSEINMLMKVAEKFGFRVNTFTHILEGYKVADKMAKHGVGAGTFSDWWAYKFEVFEAIPYNGALMRSQGVTVAFNSDDAEMARRLNQEAAKAIKYGGVPEEEAWKFVTLNPAKLLHLDKRVGSIKTGKDADLVLWSENPLSIYAKAEQTYVDGIRFFDRAEDVKMRESVAAERNRIIQKMLAEKKSGNKTQPFKGKQDKLYHCEDIEEE